MCETTAWENRFNEMDVIPSPFHCLSRFSLVAKFLCRCLTAETPGFHTALQRIGWRGFCIDSGDPQPCKHRPAAATATASGCMHCTRKHYSNEKGRGEFVAEITRRSNREMHQLEQSSRKPWALQPWCSSQGQSGAASGKSAGLHPVGRPHSLAALRCTDVHAERSCP